MFSIDRIALMVALWTLIAPVQAAKDPTRPPAGLATSAAAQTSGSQALRLESVMMGSDRKVAVINGRRVTEGDRVGDGRVARIDRDGVDLIIDNRRQRLQMYRPLNKQLKNRDPN